MGISGFPKFKEYTDSALPSPLTVPVGTKVFNTTYQVEMRSNGTRWIPLAPFIAYSEVLSDSVTGTTALATLREVNLPFKYIGKNGIIRFYLASENTNNANGKVIHVYLSDGTTSFKIYDTTTTTAGRAVSKSILADGTEYKFWSSAITALADSSTSNPIYQLLAPTTVLKLRVAGQLGNSADTVSLTRLSIQILPSF